jgi:hypothetical protein
MANDIIAFLVRTEGCCCIHSFFSKYGVTGEENMSLKRVSEISLKVGVSWRTIYRYNARIRNGTYKPCDNCKAI